MEGSIDTQQIARMQRTLERQRASFAAEGPVGATVRRDRIQRAIDLLVENEPALCEALAADFGHRSRTASRMADIVPSIRSLKYARDNLELWMAEEPRVLAEPLAGLGAEAFVVYQPKGVVGNVTPWNAPFNVCFSPLAQILAAGNRVMIKPSEHTPHSAGLLESLISRYFDETEAAVFPGGPDVGKAFTALPFDHLLFTGSGEVGRHVMAAASGNLVPVTLELGGKSPVIIGRSADLNQATDRLFNGKMLNAGQICLSPDYALVPRKRQHDVVDKLIAHAEARYPDIHANPDFTAVLGERNRRRIDDLIEDARAQGATIVPLDGGRPARADDIKRPLTLIVGPHDQMRVTQEEIFGPILPILPYDDIEQAVAYINARPRPLGLYYFGSDRDEEDYVRGHSLSGGMTVNDVLMHVTLEQLPFGGIGPSGMGAYHGVDGFKTFSHARAVYRQTSVDLAGMSGSRPPFGEKLEKMLDAAITK